MRDAIAKLKELEPLSAGIDQAGERYPRFLPASTLLGMFFFELRSASSSDIEALDLIRDFEPQRGFYGAVILRGHGAHPDDTGIVVRARSNTAYERTIGPTGLFGGATLTSTAESQGQHNGAMLTWTEVNFSAFAFDVLAVLNGTYRVGFASSFHGLDFRKQSVE